MESTSSPSCIIVACDATRDRNEHEIKLVIDHMRSKGIILSAGVRLLMLCILHKVSHPMGYQTLASPETFAGTNFRAMEEEVRKKVHVYANELLSSLEDFEIEGVTFDIQVTAGFPIRQIILQEVKNYKASWIILDRHLRRDMRFHLNKIPCKVALVKDDLSVDLWRCHNADDTNVTETKPVYSLSKFVSLSDCHSMQDIEQCIISCKSYPHSIASSDSSGSIKSYSMHSYANRSSERNSLVSRSSSKHERSGINITGEYRNLITSQIGQKQNQCGFLPKSSDAPILCTGCGIRTGLSIKESNRFSYSEIQLATNDFSKDNLIGEGGYGHVYKGVLKDGQQVAAKVRKDESTQGFSEFHSEVYVLSFARHKNIVMLLGYCCKENKNILIYEYICNKSLHWHLFENTEAVLDWPQRYGIALGTAKGLRFLHEECRGGPIIHRDMRPSNILLTHDFVPMLGDFGLAKWSTGDDPMQTRIMGTFGYLAPEYAEDGIVSEGTDVYSYGVTLLQLISGRQVGNFNNPDQQQQSLRQWAEPIIEKLVLQELIDPRLGESYDTYELYLMAKAANFCMHRKPEMRPSMREVVRLLEGESYHFHTLDGQFVSSHNT
ncbi:proline-rich receptor-like protein kinase PERK10 isoform X2 [Cicer arietinum]|uniref:Proline-rich receptor-like protein kinase PERK14 isoform X2 n=1 Tax=Cicer arietinum TaxID=3827 RepID=A0A1S2YBY2_CICAR|nr:proline-rich receptor-like protein kinase PERK14 isoform X2 [Cicer arietinum]